MLAADQPEVGDGVEFEQVGAGDLEEVPDGQIAAPGVEQRGQRVENVERAEPDLGDDLVHRAGEVLETQGRVQSVHLDAVEIVQQGAMLAEAQVDQSAALGSGPFGERLDELAVLGQVVDLPDHVVAEPQAVEDAVEAGDARAGPVVALHGLQTRVSGWAGAGHLRRGRPAGHEGWPRTWRDHPSCVFQA